MRDSYTVNVELLDKEGNFVNSFMRNYPVIPAVGDFVDLLSVPVEVIKRQICLSSVVVMDAIITAKVV